MGLFSSKTKYYLTVNSTVYNFLKDDPENYLLTLVYKYIKDNPPIEYSMADYIRGSITSNSAINMYNFIKWSKNNYNPTIGVLESAWDYSGSTVENNIYNHIANKYHNINYILSPEEFGDKVTEGYYIIRDYAKIATFDSYSYAYIKYVEMLRAQGPQNVPYNLSQESIQGNPNNSGSITLTTIANEIAVTSTDNNIITVSFNSSSKVINYTLHNVGTANISIELVYPGYADTFVSIHVEVIEEEVEPTPNPGEPEVSILSSGSNNITTRDIYNTIDESIVDFISVKVEKNNSLIINTYYQTKKTYWGRDTYENILFGSYDETKNKDEFITSTDEIKSNFLYISYYIVKKSIDDAGNINLELTLYGDIYIKGTGDDVLDTVFNKSILTDSSYAPYIPYRIWNHTINSKDNPEVFALGKKAHKKIFGENNYQTILDDINDNESINDIDFAYCSFGVPINTPYKWGKEYIWTYFKLICKYNYVWEVQKSLCDKININTRYRQGHTIVSINKLAHPISANFYPDCLFGAYSQYIRSITTKYISCSYDVTLNSTSVMSIDCPGQLFDGIKEGDVYLGTMESYGCYCYYTIKVNVSNQNATIKRHTYHISTFGIRNAIIYIPDDKNETLIAKQINPPFIQNVYPQGSGYHIRTKYNYIIIGDYHGLDSITYKTDFGPTYIANDGSGDSNDRYFPRDLIICKQTSKDRYTIIVVAEFSHINNIRATAGSDQVIHWGDNEIARYPKDKEFSGFIIPLEYNTLKAMKFIDAVNCMQVVNNLVFNCFVEKWVKVKWYQSGFFSFFLMVATIVISIVITVLSYGSTAPILANISAGASAIGTSLGYSGLTAAIVGAAASSLIAITIVSIVMPISSEIFGDAIGNLIGSLITAVSTIYILSSLAGTNISLSSISNKLLSSPSFYLESTSAIANSYKAHILNKTQKLQQEYKEFSEYASNKEEELTKLWNQNLSGSLTNKTILAINANYIAETPAQFFSRTLIYGSDIVNITKNVSVYNYVSNSLQLPYLT